VPQGKYLLIAVARIGGTALLGELMEIHVPEPLAERLKTLKGLPLTPKEVEGLSAECVFEGHELRFLSGWTSPPDDARGKSRASATKGKYLIHTMLFEKNGRSYQEYTPDKGAKVNVWIIDSSGKAVVRKKEKLASGQVAEGDLPFGCYLLVVWVEFDKGQRLGEASYMSLGRSY
jgi:hypothetical protein